MSIQTTADVERLKQATLALEERVAKIETLLAGIAHEPLVIPKMPKLPGFTVEGA